MIVSINNNTYAMSDVQALKLIEVAKETLKGKNAIVAVRKGAVLEMRNDVFTDKTELIDKVIEMQRTGFKVYYTEE